MNDRHRRRRSRGVAQRIVTVAAEQQIDARNARGELAVEREPDVRQHDEQLAVGNLRGVRCDRVPRIEKSPAEDALPEACRRDTA